MSDNDSWDNIVDSQPALHSGWLDLVFGHGWGGAYMRDHPTFIIWTKEWIYFNTEFDGYMSVHRVPRNPDNDFKWKGG